MYIFLIFLVYLYFFKPNWIKHYGILWKNTIYTTDKYVWTDMQNQFDIVWINDTNLYTDCYFLTKFFTFSEYFLRIEKIFMPITFKIKYLDTKNKEIENPYKLGLPVKLNTKLFIIYKKKKKGLMYTHHEIDRTDSLPSFYD